VTALTMPVVLNHQLSPEQREDARRRWGVYEFLTMPPHLAATWANIDPHGALDLDVATAIVDWVRSVAPVGSPVVVQGEAGMTFEVVNRLIVAGYVPVYATSERKVVETVLPDGSTETRRIFEHVQFRAYPMIRWGDLK
jgi:hypothetical protein